MLISWQESYLGDQQQIRFKPTIMVKGSMGGKVQADIAANFMFFDKFWIGGMYRTNNKFAAIVQLAMFRNLRFGYAIEYNINWDISKIYNWNTRVQIRL